MRHIAALPILWLYMLSAIGISLLILVLTLSPPPHEIAQLFGFMFGTGFMTLLLAYVVHHQNMFNWLSSLRWSLLLNIFMIILLVMVNVWVTAQLMFISTHDFYLTIGLLVFSGLTSGAFGIYVAERITARLRRLSQAAEQLAGGDWDTQLPTSERDELGEFTQTFNWMIKRLRDLDEEKRIIEQTRRDLIAGVSHDLRTPLTAIRARLEAIQDGVVTEPKELQAYIGHTLEETLHLSNMIDDLFDLAQLDAGEMKLKFVRASLRDLISDAINSMSIRAEQANLTIRYEASPNIDPVYIAPEKMQRVIYNLLDNALRYTPPNGTITISAHRVDGKVQVEVHNTDATIDSQHLPHIFDSFYRVDQSRSALDQRRGTGLGLAIARGLVEAHDGNIDVHSDPVSGTTFKFCLPQSPHLAVP